MARGRFLSKTFFTSKKVARQVEADPWHGVIYLALLVNTDVAGRFEADGMTVLGFLGFLAPILEAEPEFENRAELQRWIDERALPALEAGGLIRVWEHAGNRYGEIVDFHRHNKTRADREGASRIPGPGGLPEDAGSTPAQAEAEVQAEVQEQAQAQAQGAAAACLPGRDMTREETALAREVASFWNLPMVDAEVRDLVVAACARHNGPAGVRDRIRWGKENRGAIRNPIGWLKATWPTRAGELLEIGLDKAQQARARKGHEPVRLEGAPVGVTGEAYREYLTGGRETT